MKTEREIREYVETWLSAKPGCAHLAQNRMRLLTLAEVLEDADVMQRVREWFRRAENP